MNRLMRILGLTLLCGMTDLAIAQLPACPTAELVQVLPKSPTSGDILIFRLHPRSVEGAPIGVQIDWELVGQEANQITYDVFIHQGSVGPPLNATTLDSLPAGTYELAISPYILMGDDPNLACPPLAVPFTVAGAPSAAVPAPRFSLPGLLLLMGLFALLGWTALRRH